MLRSPVKGSRSRVGTKTGQEGRSRGAVEGNTPGLPPRVRNRELTEVLPIIVRGRSKTEGTKRVDVHGPEDQDDELEVQEGPKVAAVVVQGLSREMASAHAGGAQKWV